MTTDTNIDVRVCRSPPPPPPPPHSSDILYCLSSFECFWQVSPHVQDSLTSSSLSLQTCHATTTQTIEYKYSIRTREEPHSLAIEVQRLLCPREVVYSEFRGKNIQTFRLFVVWKYFLEYVLRITSLTKHSAQLGLARYAINRSTLLYHELETRQNYTI